MTRDAKLPPGTHPTGVQNGGVEAQRSDSRIPDLRLAIDPELSAQLLIEQLGGATLAARWLSLVTKALSREYRP
jgi:hypothetical protein